MNKKIAIIFGGMSTEHDISVISGLSVIKHINKNNYNVTPIYIDSNGEWFLYNKDLNKIEIPKLGEKLDELQKLENPIKILKEMDKVFPVLHGFYGEDGTIQGMLELLKIPYVGCKVLASSICMDKIYTKMILEKAGIPQAEYVYVKKAYYGSKQNSELEKSPNYNFIFVDNNLNEEIMEISKIAEKTIEKLGLPVFVKPSNSGSSVGINKANSKDELIEAIKYASKFDKKILIEEAINAREIECSVLETQNLVEASCVGEIIPADEFYSFDAKYNNLGSKLIIPAQVDSSTENEVREMAIKAFKAVDGNGLARIDFFIDKETNKIILNEINTMPGFTSISMYPQLWEKCGKTYTKLLDELIG